MAQLDYESQMSSARKAGLEEGLAEGRAKGREEGIKEGLTRGRAHTIADNVRSLMKSLNLTREQAMNALSLSEEDRRIAGEELDPAAE